MLVDGFVMRASARYTLHTIRRIPKKLLVLKVTYGYVIPLARTKPRRVRRPLSNRQIILWKEFIRKRRNSPLVHWKVSTT